MDRSRLLYLIRRYSENTATSSEMEELSEFIANAEDESLFAEVMIGQMEQSPVMDEDALVYEGLADRALLLSRMRGAEVIPMLPKKRHIKRWVWAAACVLLLVPGGVYMYITRHKGLQPALATVEKSSPPSIIISPGKNGAILTLSDGTTIALDSAGNGKIATQQGADVFIRKGKLSYSAEGKAWGEGEESGEGRIYPEGKISGEGKGSGEGKVSGEGKGSGGGKAYKEGKASGEVAYNTLSTPKGRQYHIELPDGTEVWLNAASSLHYPTQFSGAERTVDVTGEAYFEVAKDALRPFRVRLGKSQIEVLGTHFNVNAYSNEPAIRTTLLEGSVRFSAYREGTGDGASQLLKPGQQTQFDAATRVLTLASDVSTAQVVAWKNNLFDFNDMGLREAMQQLERWYDIDVKYEKRVSNIHFFGKMTKNIPLSDLLTILEKSKVHFQIEGRTLIVKP